MTKQEVLSFPGGLLKRHACPCLPPQWRSHGDETPSSYGVSKCEIRALPFGVATNFRSSPKICAGVCVTEVVRSMDRSAVPLTSGRTERSSTPAWMCCERLIWPEQGFNMLAHVHAPGKALSSPPWMPPLPSCRSPRPGGMAQPDYAIIQVPQPGGIR